ncbi:hypothetical protein [Candidatus Gillettellia adelgis]
MPINIVIATSDKSTVVEDVITGKPVGTHCMHANTIRIPKSLDLSYY